jgi:FdhD protein
MKQSVKHRTIVKVSNKATSEVKDLLAVEEPLEIRLGYGPADSRKQKTLAITMRTPGNDEALVLGFLYSENIINSKKDILSVKPCVNKETGELEDNVIRVELTAGFEVDLERLNRNFYTTSSCGVCGKASIELIETVCSQRIQNAFSVSKKVILDLSAKLKSDQLVFSVTGGLHATALFNENGKLELIQEDVGRHNAFDKAVGKKLLEKNIPLNKNIGLVSGRTSFELLQKAVMAGLPILCAIGAPSSLAVELAEEFNITLIGFLKENRFNIYTNPERILT